MPDHNNSTNRFHGLPNEVSQSPRAWAPSATSTAAPGLAATYDGQLWAARPQIIKATFVEGNLLEIIISLRIFVKRSPPNFQRNACLLTAVLLPSSHVQQSHFRESSVSSLRSPSSSLDHLYLLLTFSFLLSIQISSAQPLGNLERFVLPRCRRMIYI